MKYFDIKNKKVTISNIALCIPCVKALYEEMEDKDLFFKYFSYAVLSTYFNSPYLTYDIDIREGQMKKDVFGDENYKLDAKLIDFIKDLSKYSSTPTLRLLDAAENGLDFLIEEYNGLRAKAGKVDEKGKPLVTIGEVSRWLKELEAAAKSFERLRESVIREEIASSGKVRGQAEVGMYEDGLPT